MIIWYISLVINQETFHRHCWSFQSQIGFSFRWLSGMHSGLLRTFVSGYCSFLQLNWEFLHTIPDFLTIFSYDFDWI